MILIRTFVNDPHADFVIEALRRRNVPVFRLNHDLYPIRSSITVRIRNGVLTGSLTTGAGRVDLCNITTVWNRRSAPPQFDPQIDPAYIEWAQDQSDGLMQAVWTALRSAVWVNPVLSQQVANNKTLQLLEASAVGFSTPPTLLGNEPADVTEFFAEIGKKMVVKSIRGIATAAGKALYTSAVQERDLDAVSRERLRLAPACYQQHINKQYEYRVTVIGEKVWAHRIDSQVCPGRSVDWRHYDRGDVPITEETLPPDVEWRCQELIRRLNLVYGAIDLIETPEGEWVFLEINPMGQFIFLEQLTGSRMIESFCDLLVQAHRSKFPDISK